MTHPGHPSAAPHGPGPYPPGNPQPTGPQPVPTSPPQYQPAAPSSPPGYPAAAPPPAPTSPAPQQSPPTQPVSPAPAAAGQTPPADGYVLGVDLGTSHTVAVIRWPDGRARPLLVDGAPVMPSAVYLDESGHIHVGRDAQRLAQTDPTRYEPNPKHRIGETTVLLGDREVPVTALLSAILREVAAKAVEAVGHLPPAVLTCPAKWGPQFRGTLETAAAQAGFPPVRLVPEPVAAAHYFAEVMRRPIPRGSSVAVFDFGGGTLDIAVVKHQEDGSYAVQADGGLSDLGGLDVDAALVGYVGNTVNASVPQIWQQLTQPQTGTDRRNRRLFWDDVRGAKEMLSRTTVAPIPVPGVESSLHLTREELERLAGPLLERAVAETQRVIAATGQTPDQLAGLFLVGGASRIPLVGRLLHSRLGIAPTVLEQPELPVAEGSLAAGFPAAPVSPATTVPGEPYTPPPPGGQSPPDSFLGPQAPPKPWYKKKANLIAIAAGVVVLALLGWWLLTPQFPQYEMKDLAEVGTAKYPEGLDPEGSDFSVGQVDGESAYMAATVSEDGTLLLTSVNLETGKENWTTERLEPADDSSSFWSFEAKNGIVHAHSVGTDSGASYLINAENGKSTSFGTGQDTYFKIVGERLVQFDLSEDKVIGFDGSGKKQWTVDAKLDSTDYYWGHSWSSYENPLGSDAVEDSPLVFVRDDEGKVTVIDTEAGEAIADAKVGDSASEYLAYDGKLLVTTGTENYNLTAYDMTDGLKQLGSWRQAKGRAIPSAVEVCGQTRVCVLEDADDTTGSISVFDLDDPEGGVLWQSPKEEDVSWVYVAGDTLALRDEVDDSTYKTQLYDADFEKLGETQEGEFEPIDSGSFLQYASDASETTLDTYEVRGLGARDGSLQKLGSEEVYPGCAASAEQLVCATAEGYTTWRFRN